MKKTVSLIFVFLILAFSFASCGMIGDGIKGNKATEEKTEKETEKSTQNPMETWDSTERVTEPHWWDDGLYEDLNDKINI